MHKTLIRAVLGIQIVFGTLFIVQFIGEVLAIPSLYIRWEYYELIELATILSLLIGMGLSLYVIRKTAARNEQIEDQLRMVSGDFQSVLDDRFEEWGLTKAERAVALLTIKGFSVAEVASMRGKSEGTIKAQNAAIYRKANVPGRNQLLIGFVEDMIDNAIERNQADTIREL